jgi:hypothetical protein
MPGRYGRNYGAFSEDRDPIGALRDVINGALGVPVASTPRVGELYLAGRALEKAHAERRLQPRNAPAHGRHGHAALARGS